MITNLVDFGLSIRLPNIQYWEYLTTYFSQNNLVFRIITSTQCSTRFELNNGYARYILSNLSNQEIQNIKNFINTESIVRSYDKMYIIKCDDVATDSISLTLIDYDSL